MMFIKNKKSPITLVLSLGMLLSVGVFTNTKDNKVEVIEAYEGNYWDSISGEKIEAGGETLFDALHSKIYGDVRVTSYNGLKEAYKKTDLVPGTNLIWDTYGGYQYTFGKSGNSAPGAGYNREHSIPQSWFSERSPMKSDIVHVVPTDCYVNNRRSNYVFGEVTSSVEYQHEFPSRNDGNGNLIQTAGVSKLGYTTYKNSTLKVFEPDDQYKGDFARICLYFATCYPKEADDSDNATLFYDTSSFPYLTDYGVELCLKWHAQDPVSEKEINRNDGIQEVQKNRNPFVDHPEWVNKIWGNKKEVVSISVSNVKETYYQGDSFVKPTVTATYDDGTTAPITSQASFSGFDSSTLGFKTITVTYSEKSTTFDVEIIERPDVGVDHIEIKHLPNKTVYSVGETLDKTGLVVVAVDRDGIETDITNSVSLDKTILSEVGPITVTVSYTISEVTFTKTFLVEVKVEEPELKKISITRNPDKMVYNVGDEFDPTGIKVVASYIDSEITKDVSDDVIFDVETFEEPSSSYAILLSYSEGDTTTHAYLRVKVNGNVSPSGCGGNIIATSVILASLSLAGIILITTSRIIRKKKNEK